MRLAPLALPDVRRLLRGERPAGGPYRWHPEYPLTETVLGIRMLLDAHRAMGWGGWDVPPWWSHQIVMGGEVVGDAGFHGPPGPQQPAVVEIGYAVVPARRGRGIASEAVRLLLELAWLDGAELVTAEVEGDNVASRRVLAKAGFGVDEGGSYRIRRPA